ncbi:MAG TPA: hypothetical protein PLJ47_07635 [Candidatus Hydrogenedentes bacterium]|nr:hypothetical protein [Candidatus Hydrogenedentota bacterium]HRK34453.1 hypothetical protein [Candidatus Hydrogenedentota bacterium]
MRSSRANTGKDQELVDLESLAFGFGVDMLGLAQRLKGQVPDPVSNALAEHGANIGANVLEAHASPSSQLQSYAAARQSARQATYWLRLVHESGAAKSVKLDALIKAATDLTAALKTASSRARQKAETAKFR